MMTANTVAIDKYVQTHLDKAFELKTIVHIGDIHIKNNTIRQTEYQSVFNNFYTYLGSLDNLSSTIVVITGDVLDASLEKYSNVAAREFVKRVCDYTRTIIICGNHDIGFASKYGELSNLESVLSNLITKNPFYLLVKDGHYEFKNVVFSLTSLFNKQVTPSLKSNTISTYNITDLGKAIKSTRPKTSRKKMIALYHGTLTEISSNRHPFTNSSSFSIDDFRSYDYVLLGDIHKRQKVKTKGYYCGSLLQLDPTEELDKGGYLFDLVSNKVTPFTIASVTAFYKIVVEKDGTISSNIDPTKIKPNVHITVENNTFDDTKSNAIIDDLKAKGVQVNTRIVHKINSDFNLSFDILNKKYDLQDLKKTDTMLKILNEYIGTNAKISDPATKARLTDKVKDLMQNGIKLNTTKAKTKASTKKTDSPQLQIKPYRHIKLKKLTINNIAVFGKNIVLDFSKLTEYQVTNLYAPNDYGKSSLIEAIILSITGTSNKFGKLSDYIHYNESTASLKMELMVNKDAYVISRNYTRRKNPSDKVEEDLIITKNNVTTEGKKLDQEQYIKEHIAECDELLNSSIIEQSRNKSLLQMDNKLNALLSYIDLGNYGDLMKYCTERRKYSIYEKGQYLKELKDVCSASDLLECKTENGDTVDCTKLLQMYTDKMNRLSNEIAKQGHQIREYDDSIRDIEMQNVRLGTISEYSMNESPFDFQIIEQKSKEYKQKRQEYDEKTKIVSDLTKAIGKNKKLLQNSKHKLHDANTHHMMLGKLQSDIRDDNNSTINMAAAKRTLQQTKAKLKKCKPSTPPSHDQILQTIELYVSHRKNELLNEVKSIIKTKKIEHLYTEIDDDIDPVSQYTELIKTLRNDTVDAQIAEIEKDITFLKNRIHNIEQNEKIAKIKKDLEDHDKYMALQKANDTNTLAVDKLQIEVQKIQLEMDAIQDSIAKENDKEGKDAIIEENRLTFNENVAKMGSLIQKQGVLRSSLNVNSKVLREISGFYNKVKDVSDRYAKSINDCDDFDKLMLIIEDVFINLIVGDKIIKKIEESVNCILRNIEIDELKIELTKDKQDINIVRKNTTTNILRSGKFYYNIYDLVFRMVINRLNQSLKQDYLIIDELVDGASDKNKPKVISLINYLRNYYDWVLLITHDEKVREYVDHIITIDKKDGYSCLNC